MLLNADLICRFGGGWHFGRLSDQKDGASTGSATREKGSVTGTVRLVSLSNHVDGASAGSATRRSGASNRPRTRSHC